MTHPEDERLLQELEPVVARLLDRHLATAQDWLPHEYVPWSRGRDYTGTAGVPWEAGQSTLDPRVRAAFELNLLTEDNLPSYHHSLRTRLGTGEAWGTWVHRWTAEEARHATGIRDYLLVTRATDPEALERDRMRTMQAGYRPDDADLLGTVAYLALQELATRLAHQRTGERAGDPAAERLLRRVAADENLHLLFYRDLFTAALEMCPDRAVEAVAGQVIAFRMPGSAVAGFLRRTVLIADAGIYDARSHRDHVITPLLRHWAVLDRKPATTAAGRAQEALATHVDHLDALACRADERRAERMAAAGDRPGRDGDPRANHLVP